jgi:hypothetical protein
VRKQDISGGPRTRRALRPLAERLEIALDAGGEALDMLAAAGRLAPLDRRDEVLTLLALHDLHLAPIDALGERVRLQHHPVVARLKAQLESSVLARLEALDAATAWDLPQDDAVAAMRALAARGLVPEVYDWLADDASWDEAIAFFALEGGPDGGFDDLVAVCQVGLTGEPKLELAQNYWDEMGRGTLADVHTELHRRLSKAVDMPVVPRDDQPIESLERVLLGSLLATNRWLQPEMVGALGLLELQAGPRCRKVVKALERLGASEDALAFYQEHAVADPRHGKDWVDHVIAPLAADDPTWATRIVRGARWRSLLNNAFFTAMAERFVPRSLVDLTDAPSAPAPAAAGRQLSRIA